MISDVKSKDGRQGIIFLYQLLLFNVKLCRLKHWKVSVFIYCDFILILFRPAISRNKKHDTINPMFKNYLYLGAHVHTLYVVRGSGKIGWFCAKLRHFKDWRIWEESREKGVCFFKSVVSLFSFLFWFDNNILLKF